uniref:Predicted protein n=2 Tax=Mesangiospermae TaxID=1437183 RepID=F2DXD3_HORVV|nr:predicted protein [Hordeum vulgare subsp. vulgare]
MAFKTNLVVDKADELFISQQHLWSATHLDVARLFTPISTLGVFYIIQATMKLITQVGGQYAIKVSYSKDKELIFVKRVNNFGQVEEDVYETAHLEILPPRQRSGVKDLSSQDADGLWRITCLNSQRNIILYNNDAFWNRKLKAPFLQSFLNLWDKSYYGYNRKEQEEHDRKWREEVFNSINQEALPSK